MSDFATNSTKAALRCFFFYRCHRYCRLCITALLFHAGLHAQEDGKQPDSIPSLGDIIIKGFGNGSSRWNMPASVSVVRSKELARFSQTSLVPVLNMVPGVRMEERSPGSYRLSIRGSLLRSPFGIRNVKVYLDDCILTDAGGNTYLNLLDMNMLGQVEVIRGPGGSLYGSGTGGVLHLSSQPLDSSHRPDAHRVVQAQWAMGSYGQYMHAVKCSAFGKHSQVSVYQGTYLSDGYRKNSQMRRDLIQVDASTKSQRGDTYRGFFILSDLAYRTPGGLTSAQQTADPRQARPATLTLASAEAQRTGIHNQTALAGYSMQHRLRERMYWRNAFTVSRTRFENPFFSNYEKRHESNLGFRSIWEWRSRSSHLPMKWIAGAEWQRGYYRIDSSGNQGGIPDARRVQDEVASRQGFLFAQAELELPGSLRLQSGISLSQFSYHLQRKLGTPAFPVSTIGFDRQPAPRLALLWKPARTLSLHASITKGFSPPSLAEVKPSAGGFAIGLQAEKGWSRELGIKGSAWRNRLQFDAVLFDFLLNDAIVRRSNAAGAEFFVNAGDTRQRGMEGYLEILPIQSRSLFLRQMRLWSSQTHSQFRFGAYQQGSLSYEGNRLTGVPDKTLHTGIDFLFKGGFYCLLTRYDCSAIPLTDANDAFADPYTLWNARIGWKYMGPRGPWEIYLAGENLTDQLYSSGNDLNAFGRRYYNPAPRKSWMLGFRMGF